MGQGNAEMEAYSRTEEMAEFGAPEAGLGFTLGSMYGKR